MNESGDLQLSQSATDVGVFVELPGAVVESVRSEVIGPKVSEEPTDDVTTDPAEAPDVVSGQEELPPKESLQSVKESQPSVKESQPSVKESQPSVKESQPGVKESQPDAAKAHDDPEGEVTDIGTKEVCVAERRRILTKIEKSKLLRDEMMRQEPSLSTVASFMSTLCGGPTEQKYGKRRKGRQKPGNRT